MFINDQGKRVNPYAPVELDGVRYPSYPLHLLTEIPDPQPPEDYSEETYYRTEQGEAPYVVYTKKSDEQIAQIQQAKVNAQSLAYLASTDWMVIRAAEGGTPLSEEVKVARQAARDAIVHQELP